MGLVHAMRSNGPLPQVIFMDLSRHRKGESRSEHDETRVNKCDESKQELHHNQACVYRHSKLCQSLGKNKKCIRFEIKYIQTRYDKIKNKNCVWDSTSIKALELISIFFLAAGKESGY